MMTDHTFLWRKRMLFFLHDRKYFTVPNISAACRLLMQVHVTWVSIWLLSWGMNNFSDKTKETGTLKCGKFLWQQ